MSNKPAYPTWDSNGTHLIAPVAGHKTDGYGAGEVPASDEINGQLNLIYQNIAFLDQKLIAGALIDLLPMLDPTNVAATDPEMMQQAPATDCVYAFTLSGGSAYLKQGSANNKLKIAPGILIQLAGSVILAYRFAGTDEVTIANGDPSNPRVDIVQMKIDTVAGTQVPSVTLSVKQGTPAVSPTYPAPDAGYCVIAGVVVGTNYVAAAGFVLGADTAGAVAVVHDQRVPLHVKAYTTMPNESMFTTDWALAGAGEWLQKQNNNGGGSMYFPLKGAGYTGRLLDLAQGFLDKNTQDSRITRMQYADGGSGSVVVANVDLAPARINGSGTNAFSRRHTGLLFFQGAPTFAAGPVVQKNANGMGAPIWTNGRRCVTAPFTDATDGSFPVGHSILALRWVAPGTADSGSQWGPATFWVAGGL